VLRVLAIALLIAGAAIGLGEPVSIVLVVLGLPPIILDRAVKQLPHELGR
jgi:hypothetical protein